jgi:hypothetical protein
MWFTILWIVWGLLFLVLEGFALYRFKDESRWPHTLSGQIWWAVRGRGLFHWAARIVVAGFMAWLAFHFLN